MMVKPSLAAGWDAAARARLLDVLAAQLRGHERGGLRSALLCACGLLEHASDARKHMLILGQRGGLGEDASVDEVRQLRGYPSAVHPLYRHD